MRILGDFIATGAQLRIERPGKACAATPCDSIEGPTVKLYDERVIQINTEEEAVKNIHQIKEILFLGDLLFAYGEFARNNHILVPSPFVEEWWVQELEKAATDKGIKLPTDVDEHQALQYSLDLGIPLHPKLIYFYNDLDLRSILTIYQALETAKVSKEGENFKLILSHDKTLKKALEIAGVPHTLTDEGIILENETSLGFLYAFAYLPEKKYDIQK